MLITSLLLTVSTTLSGTCNQISTSKRIEAIRTDSIALIESVSSDFITNESFLDYEKQIYLLKQSIYEYNFENNLLDNQYLEVLEEIIEEDNELILTSYNATSVPLESSLSTEFTDLRQNVVKNLNSISIVQNEGNVKRKISDININICEDISLSDDSSSNGETLPIYEYDISKAAVYNNWKLDGVPFVGIALPKDTCIAFYNAVATFFNNQAIFVSAGSTSAAGIIINALKLLAPTTTNMVIAKITSYFTSIWLKFTSYLAALPAPFNAIVIAVLVIVGATAAFILATMFVLGYLKKGYAVGWKVHSLFNWEWYSDEIS